MPANLCWYRQALERRPIVTKSTTAAILSLLASVIAQRKYSRLNWGQIRNEAIIGFVLRGTLVHTWHRVLNRIAAVIIGADRKSNSFLIACLMMVIDQIVFAPFMALLYFVLTGLLNHRSLSQIYLYLKKHYFQILQKNYQIWPFATLINFSLVPEQFRVVFANIVSFFWTIYLISKTQVNLALSPTENERQYFKERFD